MDVFPLPAQCHFFKAVFKPMRVLIEISSTQRNRFSLRCLERYRYLEGVLTAFLLFMGRLSLALSLRSEKECLVRSTGEVIAGRWMIFEKGLIGECGGESGTILGPSAGLEKDEERAGDLLYLFNDARLDTVGENGLAVNSGQESLFHKIVILNLRIKVSNVRINYKK